MFGPEGSTVDMEWFHRLYLGRETFQDEQEELAYRESQRALTRAEAEEIRCLLGLNAGSRVLDLYCGNGRHAVELAQRGLQVVGIDISRSRIAFASRWARDEAPGAAFLVADARSLPLRTSFHAVLILGGSFSHCLEDGENIALLRTFATVLLPGGILLIDNPNPLRFWRVRHPQSTVEEMARVSHFDLPLGQGGSFGVVRYHCVERMARLFREAGMEMTRALGDRKGGDYDLESPRMIVIGRTRQRA